LKDGSTLLEAVVRLSPDVGIMDINMPDLNGSDVCRLIRQSAPKTRVVIVMLAMDVAIRQQAFAAGASAFA